MFLLKTKWKLFSGNTIPKVKFHLFTSEKLAYQYIETVGGELLDYTIEELETFKYSEQIKNIHTCKTDFF